jgi:hypothetical protein
MWPALLPILKGAEIYPEAPGKFGLAKPEALADGNNSAGAVHSGELLVGHRLRIRIGKRGGLNFLVGHSFQPFPICPAFRPWITAWLVANKLFFHDDWLSLRL